MLNKELSHFAENNKSGAQISDYLYSTYTGRTITIIEYTRKLNLNFVFFLFSRQERTRC